MLSPRLKILILLAIAVVCFVLRNPAWLAALFALHLVAWFALRLPAATLGRLVRKLSFFVIMIVLAFALFPPDTTPSSVAALLTRWGYEAPWIAGLFLGGMMALRMLTVIIASQIVQLTSKPGEFVAGLRGLMIPEVAALTIDSTLYLLGPQAERQKGGGMSAGGGGGQGRHRAGSGDDQAAPVSAFSLAGMKRLKSGDFGFLVEMIEQGLTRAKAYVGAQEHQGRKIDATVVHDVSIISGLCLLMMTTKLLKILPGVPFAPGYKITFLVPLYILAAELTRTRFGATITGTTVGVISFLFGDGRFGIFEILKHITPGLVIDLALPLTRRWIAKPSRLAFMVLGAVCALTRATTMLAVVFFVQGNALLFTLVGFQGASQVFFGALSGFVTFYLVNSLGRLRGVAEASAPAETAAGMPNGGGGGGDGSGGGTGGGQKNRKQSLLETKIETKQT